MNRKRKVIDRQIDMLIRRSKANAAKRSKLIAYKCPVAPAPVPVAPAPVPVAPAPVPVAPAPVPVAPAPVLGDVHPISVPGGITIFPHQERVVRRMVRPGGDRGLLVCHSMGSGKTLLSLVAGYAMRAAAMIDRIMVIAPNSVQDYWTSNVNRLGMSDLATVFTHHSFPVGAVDERTLLVVDEAHNFRTPITKKRPFESQKAYRMLVAASAACKVLLLSGTPIVNAEEDLKNILLAIHGNPFDYESYKLLKPSMHQAWPYTDFHSVDSNDPRLPSCVIRREVFTMSPPFLAWYNSVEDDVRESMGFAYNLKKFMNGIRRAVNGCSWISTEMSRRSPKIEWLREHIATCMIRKEKVMVYSAWKTFGVKNVCEALKDRCPDVVIGVIDGDASTTARADTVSDFNQGRLHVLIVTAAGSEGIDLKGTRHVVILEPHWNSSRTDQAIGRACRINSHTGLPQEEQNVTVYNLILQKPEASMNDTRRPYESADVILEMKSQQKKNLCTEFIVKDCLSR